MNMIMHGDGHGGIHYHDGLVDINGVFAGRFDLVLTNPPFGQNVGDDQKFGGTEETRVPNERAYLDRCRERYGRALGDEPPRQTQKRAAEKKPILEVYEIGKGKTEPPHRTALPRTLHPTCSSPAGAWASFCPTAISTTPRSRGCGAGPRAGPAAGRRQPAGGDVRLRDATVKASLVFLRRFTEADAAAWEDAWAQAEDELYPVFDGQRDTQHGARAQRHRHRPGPRSNPPARQLAALGLRRQLPAWGPGASPRPIPAA